MFLTAETINLVYFAFLVALSFVFPLSAPRRVWISTVGAAGALLVLGGVGVSLILPERLGWPLRDWLPAVVLLFAYWQAGWFFTGPNPGLQQFLGGIDRCIRTALGKWAHPFGSGWVGRYFELTYVAAYPLVPFGLATLYLFRYDDYVDYFWSVVLPASYACYLMLPFAPTLPPRLEMTGDSDTSGVDTAGRRLNLWILGNLGVGANTFPSGHVAATFATALVVAEFVSVAGFLFLWTASSIAVAVVVRRYHYLADSALGILVAWIVWTVVRAMSA